VEKKKVKMAGETAPSRKLMRKIEETAITESMF
jgi:hypothetical protein